jgi:V/A-type H+-transporting ATPase subunit C
MTVRLSDDPAYGFAVGRVRSLESGLLDRSRYDRLIHTRDIREFVSTLGEVGYARFFEGCTDVPEALDRAAAESLGFFTRSVPARDGWLVDLFRLPALFRQLKSGLKRALSSSGDERAAAVKSAAAAYQGPAAERVVKTALEAAAHFEKHADPAEVDMTLDRLMQVIRRELAAGEFLAGFLRLHADVENLRMFMRVRAAPEDGLAAAELRRGFLPGGIVGGQTMVDLLDEPCDTAVERLTKAPPAGCGSEVFFDYLEQGACEGTEKRSITRMERLGRELELRYLRQTRYATFGHEPLVTFYLLQENELRNLRQLHAAKVARLPADVVQELVAYVD